MSDYGSLKVVDLKRVLKERGLPVSGNKAELIKRLEDADASATVIEQSAGEEALEKDQVVNPSAEGPSEAPSKGEVDLAPQDQAVADAPVTILEASVRETVAEDTSHFAERANGPRERAGPNVALPHTDTTIASSTQIQAAEGGDSGQDSTLNTVDAVQTERSASHPEVDTLEQRSSAPEESVLSDRNSRRKRSLTPAPDAREISKKLKSVNAEDEADAPARMEQEPPTKVASSPDGPDTPRPIEKTGEAINNIAQTTLDLADADPVNDEKTRKSSHDPRADRHPPAQHPTTKTVYIAGLKRPLQTEKLKSYLSGLALNGADEDVEPISEFFIDSIKTHCFAQFADSSTAQRVRDLLHGQAWPKDAGHDPLSVDFIPDERFSEWRQLEHDSEREQRRWRVVYQTRDSHVTAQLVSDRPIAAAGVAEREEKSASHDQQHRDDRAKGFKTLDDLFIGTSIKPKLYYKPVDDKTTQLRLARLRVNARRRVGRGANVMAKYSFESGKVLVDCGPDDGLRLDRPRGFVGGPTFRRFEIRPEHRRGHDTRR